MGRVLTNSTGLRMAYEASTGVLPGSPVWYVVEFDTIGNYGATITTVPRRPISQDRGRKKGTPTDQESAAEFETDLTVSAFALFAEGFFFAEYANLEFVLQNAGAPPTVTGGSPTGYTISAASALLAGKVVWVSGGAITLVYAKGYAVAANNGIKVLTADLAASGTTITVSGLATEASPPANASLQVCGVRTDDVTVTVALDGTGTLVSAADVANWATLGLRAGMTIHIGGANSSLVLTNSATIAATTVYGYARVVSISGTTLTFDKADANLLLGGAGSSSGSQTIDFLFGRFVRDVAVTANADDTRYLERTHQFELSFPGLGTAGATEYEYAVGNFGNSLAFNLPLTNKATMSLGFIGTSSDTITATRKTGASTATNPLRNTAFSTSIDIVSLTTDVVSSVSDVCFKSITLSMLNNVSPEKCLGTQGARFVNAGLFEFNLEGQMLFTNKAIVNAIRNNTSVTFNAVLRNQDGAIALDIPEMTLSGGAREYPVDQSVLVNITGGSVTNSTYGYNASASILAVVPTAAA